jgi:NADH oxidase (H2O2-forming)
MTPWTLKLVFDRNQRTLIGGQILSRDIAPTKEIDAVSALILGRKTVEDVTVFVTAGNPDISSEPSLEPLTIAAEQCLQKMGRRQGA